MANGEYGIGSVPTGELMLRSERAETEPFEDFDDLYLRCRPDLVRYAERRNAQDAELLADLALIDVYRALDRLRSDHPRVVWAYLYRALDNHLRREGAKPAPELRNDLEELGGSYSFEDDVIGHLSLDDMLAMLSSNQELALRPKLEKNLSAEEIGAQIGKSADAVRQLQHKAIRRLRRVLFVVALVLVGLLAAVLGDGDVVVDQSPATSGTEQAPPETTVADRPGSAETTLLVPDTSVPPTSTGDVSTGGAGGGISAGQEPADAAAVDGQPTGGVTAPTTTPSITTVPPTTLVEPAPAPAPAPTPADGAGAGQAAAVGDAADGAAAAAEVADPENGALLGSFALVSAWSGNCIDQPSSQDDGGRVIQWRCAGHTAVNQIFVATPGNGGTMLAFAHSNKCLDESNQVISQWTCHGGDNQLFNWNGSQLQSKETGLCLTLGDEVVGNGSTLRTEPCVNAQTQQFSLERYGGQLLAG